MFRSKSLRYLVLALAVLLFNAARADVLDDILERGTLRIGVSLFRPWTMRATSGELIGSEIDMGKQIAADMGVEPEFKVYVWEQIIPALQSGEIDVIAGGMAITPARALDVNFTRPYAESGVALAANTRKTRNIDSLEALDDEHVVITTVANTLADDVTERIFRNAQIRVLGTQAEAEQLLLDGKAHAYVAGSPETTFLALQHPDVVDLPLDELLLSASEALAVRKGEQEWLNYLNAWIEARKADHWLSVTRQYWFMTIDWMAQLAEK